MASIFEVVTPKLVATKWEESVLDREPYLLETFFGEEKQIGTEISYLKGNTPKVRPLDLSAYDVKALPLSREAFEKVTTELPFFKNFLSINEKERQELLKVLATGNAQYIDVVLNRIYNDEAHLLTDASVTREMLRGQLLTTGALAFSSNGQAIAYDFGVPDANKITLEGTAVWTDVENSDPLTDITNWQDQIETATGVRPSNILMNRVTFNLMKKSASVKNAIYILANGKVTPSDKEVKQYFSDNAGVTIYIYNKGYYPQGSTEFVKFIPDYVVSLFPDVEMGKFVFGTTPEEADLMSGATDAVVELVDLGVAITATKETDPVNVKMKVSMTGIPTLEYPNQLLIATVGTGD